MLTTALPLFSALYTVFFLTQLLSLPSSALSIILFSVSLPLLYFLPSKRCFLPFVLPLHFTLLLSSFLQALPEQTVDKKSILIVLLTYIETGQMHQESAED